MNPPQSARLSQAVTLLLLLFAVACGSFRTVARPPGFQSSVPPTNLTFAEAREFFTDHCGKCHGEKTQKSGVNLAPFLDEKAILKQRKTWGAVTEQLYT